MTAFEPEPSVDPNPRARRMIALVPVVLVVVLVFTLGPLALVALAVAP